MKTARDIATDTPTTTRKQNTSKKENTMNMTRNVLIAVVLLGGLFAAKARALTYVLSEAGRALLQAEYEGLKTRRLQTLQEIRNLNHVLSSSQTMFVFNLNGSKRWEYWPTNQVGVRLRQISPAQANYRAWWNRLLQQHLQYAQYVKNGYVPSLHQKVAQIDRRMAEIQKALNESGQKTGLTNVSVNRSPVHIKMWDHGSEDGDIVQIFVNGQFYRQLRLTKGPATVTLPLAFGNHRLEVRAVNEGSDSPNTASISITGVVRGKPQQSWRLKTGQTAGMWITVGNG